MAEKEYIERNNVISHKRPFTEFDEGGWSCKVQAVAVEDIQNIPAVDVAPVRHGHWERNKSIVQCDVCGFGLFPDGYFFENGECTHANEQNFRLNFCPNCGAKMDGGNLNAE